MKIKYICILIVIYLIIDIIMLTNFSNNNLNKFNNTDYEYFLSNVDEKKFESIDEFWDEHNVSVFSIKYDNTYNTEYFYVNTVFLHNNSLNYNDELYLFTTKIKLLDIKSLSNYKYSIDFVNDYDKELFDEFLTKNNVTFTYNNNLGSFEFNTVYNQMFSIITLVTFIITLLVATTNLRTVSIKITNGYSKQYIILMQVIKNISLHLLILSITLIITAIYFIIIDNLNMYTHFLIFVISNIVHYLMFIIIVNLPFLVLSRFKLSIFLKTNSYFKPLTFINALTRGIFTILVVLILCFEFNNFLTLINLSAISSEWDKIDGYQQIEQTYNINVEFTEEEHGKSIIELNKFYIENYYNSMFIAVPSLNIDNSDEYDIYRKNVVFTNSNYFTVTNIDDINDTNIVAKNCGEKCIEVILSETYKQNEDFILQRVYSHLEIFNMVDFDVSFSYYNDFSVYSYDLDYNEKNKNYFDNPIVIVDNPNVSTPEYYQNFLGNYFVNGSVVVKDSDYYRTSNTSNEYYARYQSTLHSYIVYTLIGCIVLIIALILFNSYLISFYISTNIKKITILRTNGYTTTDIYSYLYAYLVIVYLITLGLVYLIVNNVDFSFTTSFYGIVIILFIIDMIYLNWLILRLELKSISSLIKGEVL